MIVIHAVYECLVKLEQFDEAGKIGLKLIAIAKTKNDDSYLRASYERMVDFYKEHLDEPEDEWFNDVQYEYEHVGRHANDSENDSDAPRQLQDKANDKDSGHEENVNS